MALSSVHWITVVWSMASAVCFTLAVINATVWFRRRTALASGIFAAMAAGTGIMALSELAMMHAETPGQYTALARWFHVPAFVVFVAIVCFVRVYLDAGRRWLAWTACLLRGASLGLNFAVGENLNFLHIATLRRVPLLGDHAAVAEGTRNPLMLLAQLSLLLLLVYVADASAQVWRRGQRRKALVAGGAIFLFILLGTAQAIVSLWGFVDMPITPSVFFVGVIAVMGLELSRDMLRAGELATELHEGEQRLALAAEAANLGVWSRDPGQGEVWASPQWRRLFGFSASEPITLENYLGRVHPEDRSMIREILWQPNRPDHRYEAEYRVVLPDGQMRWIASRGRFETNGSGRLGPARGVSVDVTSQKTAEHALEEQRTELAHLSRVAMLGELSGSLAHELNQPLTAILSNAQAAQRFLAQPDFDRREFEEILRDIVEADLRAGEVIRSLRALFKKGPTSQQRLDVNSAVREVLRLVRSDLLNHHVAVEMNLAPDFPGVTGDRVQLQQVLLNLILNAMDAMAETDEKNRRLVVGTDVTADGVRVGVRDSGPGVPSEMQARIFEPFFTTKSQGLGLGLSVCRSILEAHASALHMKNSPDAGAEFFFVLPAEKEAA